MEKTFGKGGLRDRPDPRDYQFSQIASAYLPFDWSQTFDIENIVGKLPVKNQFSSSSCGGQAWATYSYVLDKTDRQEKSAKFIYSQTHVLSGGSDGRTNCQLCVKKGVCNETLCSSYLPDKTTTEAYMTTTNDITAKAYADAITNTEKSYLAVNTDIDSVAQAIVINNGVVIGITGKNNGTWLTAFPLKPDNWNNSWNHWVFAGKIKMINEKKYIGILNSWGTSVGEQGWQWIGEDYFKDYVWSCWTMMYNEDVPFTFTKTLRIGDRGLDVKMLQTKLGIISDGIFGKKTLQAVKDFQTKHKLVADGIVGKLTNKILNSI